jgi:hypothetical protein
MRIATAVVVDHAVIANPEPGVARAPTPDEQMAAIESYAVRHGMLVHAEPVVHGPDDSPDPDLPMRNDGVICSTLAVLGRDGVVDLELLDTWRSHGRPLGFLVEDLWFDGVDDGFEQFRLMVTAINAVRRRPR